MKGIITLVPTYRVLSVAGNVLDRDEQGGVYHTLVMDTTSAEIIHCVYEIR